MNDHKQQKDSQDRRPRTRNGRRAAMAGIAGAGALGAAAAAGMLQPLTSQLRKWIHLPGSDRMPAIFVGHGTPMSAIRPNQWTESWSRIGSELPTPQAILAISAHWLTQGGALVTASDAPQMNYDMYGFPQELYEITYPAPGDVELAKEVAFSLNRQLPVYGDREWGLDHGTWVVLKYMFPRADIPVIQLSIDYSKPPEFHYELARQLQFLRTKGVLIFGSGNMVHNLGMRTNTNNQPFDWALEFDHTMTRHIFDGNHQAVAGFLDLGSMASLSHPTYDHFLPLLYCLGVRTDADEVRTFGEAFQWPAVSMRSFLIA